MKRIERNTYNSLRKSITADTINVEIPVEYTHEGRQGIHEMLTVEKHMRASMICWNSITNGYVIHYVPTVDEYTEAQRMEQESQDIDEVMNTLPKSDRTWNGYEKPAEEQTTDTDTEEEEEEETMFTNYTEAVTADAVEYIHDNYTAEEIAEALTDRDEFAENLNDEMWVADEVTGNASGSYTFDRMKAREYVLHDIAAVRLALREFATPADTIAEKFLAEDWEYFDVTARCYVLGQAIEAALDIIEAETKAA